MTRAVLVRHRVPDRAPEVEYAFRALLRIVGLAADVRPIDQEGNADGTGPIVYYGTTLPEGMAGRCVHILPAAEFWEDVCARRPIRWAAASLDGVPVLFRGTDAPPDVRPTTHGVETNIDIVAGAFLLLTRYEEAVTGARDEHGRFPAEASAAESLGVLDRPLVDEYARWLGEWIRTVDSSVEPSRAWTDRPAAACVTHDVDALKMFGGTKLARGLFRDLLRERAPRRAVRRSTAAVRRYLFGASDPFDTFGWMWSVADQAGFPSTYFVLAGEAGARDGDYALADPATRQLLQAILRRGDEIGLHSGYDSHDCSDRLAAEQGALAETVGAEVCGVRQHFLRWSTPASWRARADAGFLYDSSLGYPDAEGFRCGTCTPFQPFDIDAREPLPLVEVPLVVMDGTLRQYRGYAPAEALMHIERLIDAVVASRGVFVLLWHNSALNWVEWPGWREVYLRTLEMLARRRVIWSTVGDVVRCWREHVASREGGSG